MEIKKKEEYKNQGSFMHLDSFVLNNRQLEQFAGKSLANNE